MDDDHRFLYALAAGSAVSGLMFWLVFWHSRVLLGAAWGVIACLMLWFRYRGPSHWNRLRHHGKPRELREFKATIFVFALLVIAVSIVLSVKGLLR